MSGIGPRKASPAFFDPLLHTGSAQNDNQSESDVSIGTAFPSSHASIAHISKTQNIEQLKSALFSNNTQTSNNDDEQVETHNISEFLQDSPAGGRGGVIDASAHSALFGDDDEAGEGGVKKQAGTSLFADDDGDDDEEAVNARIRSKQLGEEKKRVEEEEKMRVQRIEQLKQYQSQQQAQAAHSSAQTASSTSQDTSDEGDLLLINNKKGKDLFGTNAQQDSDEKAKGLSGVFIPTEAVDGWNAEKYEEPVDNELLDVPGEEGLDRFTDNFKDKAIIADSSATATPAPTNPTSSSSLFDLSTTTTAGDLNLTDEFDFNAYIAQQTQSGSSGKLFDD